MYQIAQQLSQQVIVCVSLSSFSRLTCLSFSSAQLDQPMALLSRMAAAAAANRAVGTMLWRYSAGRPSLQPMAAAEWNVQFFWLQFHHTSTTLQQRRWRTVVAARRHFQCGGYGCPAIMALGNVVGPFISTTPVVYPFIEVLYVCLCVCESVLHLSRLCSGPAELGSVGRGHRLLRF